MAVPAAGSGFSPVEGCKACWFWAGLVDTAWSMGEIRVWLGFAHLGALHLIEFHGGRHFSALGVE